MKTSKLCLPAGQKVIRQSIFVSVPIFFRPAIMPVARPSLRCAGATYSSKLLDRILSDSNNANPTGHGHGHEHVERALVRLCRILVLCKSDQNCRLAGLLALDHKVSSFRILLEQQPWLRVQVSSVGMGFAVLTSGLCEMLIQQNKLAYDWGTLSRKICCISAASFSVRLASRSCETKMLDASRHIRHSISS